MLVKEPQATVDVYTVTDAAITHIGEVNNFSSLQFTSRFVGFGTLEMYVPLTQENIEYCSIGNMLLVNANGDYSYIIYYINNIKDEEGFVKIHVKGRTLEWLLSYRCVYQTLMYDNDYVSSILYNIVDENFIHPTQAKRVLPHIELATDTHLGPQVKLQRSGRTVKERLDDLCTQYNLGYFVHFDIDRLKFVFEVVEHVDKSIGQSDRDTVIFDTDNQDILTSDFLYDNEDEKNTGLVVGEIQDDGSGTTRIRAKVVVGDDTLQGYARKEIYIDARDLQSEYEDNTGSIEEMSDAEYQNMLLERGAKKLSENVAVKSFEANIRYYYSQYEFGVDYNVGDIVTFYDREMGVMINAFVSEVEQVYTDTYELRISIGYDRPTLYSKILQMLNI